MKNSLDSFSFFKVQQSSTEFKGHDTLKQTYASSQVRPAFFQRKSGDLLTKVMIVHTTKGIDKKIELTVDCTCTL